ncbi:hypothetical protein D8M04_05970 [Oceanobacillus piezotolerans]|uniref:Uncharacterized protein n=1 Tax=Oceanobacillus piezotolerans TaxID=2448030 RepID=A0A498DAY8_9BACI|nr:hypothetical protein [Oceanobacillus piezotolerans]RLL46748.1 hypothetical protein D8M04_05970 [Oceanobacillus piezotolerans]
MLEPVATIGSILTFIVFLIGLVGVRASSKQTDAVYYPSFFLAVCGLTFLAIASMVNKEFLGAPLGGWGIACMFSAAIGFILTSMFDVYKNSKSISEN